MVGSRIKELRLANKITLRKLHDLTGLAVSNITLIEQDKVSPSIETLEKIAIALKCKQTDFFKDDGLNINIKHEENETPLHGFTIDLVNRLLSEGIIKDKDDIDQNIIDAIKSALLLDAKKKH